MLFLHTTVETCGYLRYCHLVSYDQSDTSPLTSLINKAFLPVGTAAHRIFLVFLTILC